ncbi:hypothetical protein KDL45_16115, partial [bacterium]|nr:hypothetical protein [bacterium]
MPTTKGKNMNRIIVAIIVLLISMPDTPRASFADETASYPDRYAGQTDVRIERIDGTKTEHYGFGMVAFGGGRVLISAMRGRELVLYDGREGHFTSEVVSPDGAISDLAMDDDGRVHIVFRDRKRDEIIYAHTDPPI